LPARTDVVIVGGGVIGCAIAWHLAKLGITDVVLLERRQLTCGTTWHAAGLIGQLRSTRNLTTLARYTTELLGTLERETGQATGFRQNGSISVALTAARFEELKRQASMARGFGLEVETLTASEVLARYPLLDGRGVTGGVWLPRDGQADPVGVTLAFARGARSLGVRIVEGRTVRRILVHGGVATGVRLDDGEIRADAVVLASGMWSHALARDIGVAVPLHAAEHFYAITEPIDGLPRDLPVLRVPDEETYVKEDAGKLLVGAFEARAKPWGMAGIPEDFAFDSLPDDLDHFGPVLERAAARVPVLARTGIRTWFNGPESFTPDDRYLLGETPEVRRLFVAAGFNSIGIQSSGGAGKVLAEWIRDGHEPIDLADVDVRRMHPGQATRRYLRDRTVESLGLLYADHWPHRQYATARGARRSPLHDRLVAMRACMGEFAGWERPQWFAAPGERPEFDYGWGVPVWHRAARDECMAVRDRVALFDQTSFAKFRIDGADACRILQRVCSNDVDVAPGRIVYTQWLNARGGIEADLTVARLAESSFLVVTGAGSQVRDFAWLARAIPPDARCTALDVTSAQAVIGVMGPASRALLEAASGDRFDNDRCPFGHAIASEIGYAPVRAARITYVGELGWEIYVATEFAANVFDALVAEGAAFGARPAGFQAMTSCRVEKGYRHWGHDIGVDDTPLEAGLAFAVAWDKPVAFTGRDALLRRRDAGPPRRRLVQFALAEADALVHGEEPIACNGSLVGRVTSGAVGHRVGESLAMGYVTLPVPVTQAELDAHDFAIEVAGRRVAARARLAPRYDPASARVRA